MEAPANGHSVGPVVVTYVCFRVDVAVPKADAAKLLEVPMSRVLVGILVDSQVPIAMPFTLEALLGQVPLEMGLELGEVEEGVRVGVVHVHVCYRFHIICRLYIIYENK